MTQDAQVQGAEQFLRLSKALKEAGQTKLRAELNKQLAASVRPMVPLARASARSRLPQRGGLAARVAKSPMSVKVATGTKTFGVRVVVIKRQGTAARGLNRGQFRHPVFGDRDRFVVQEVEPGWFDDVAKAQADDVRKAALAAIEAVADKVIRDVRR